MNRYKLIILSIYMIFPFGIIAISVNLIIAIAKDVYNLKRTNPPKTIANT